MGFTVILSLIYMLIFGGLIFLVDRVLFKSGKWASRTKLLLAGLLVLTLLLVPIRSFTVFYETHFLFPMLVVPLSLVLSTLLLLNAFRRQDAEPNAPGQQAGSSPWEGRASLLLSGLLLLAAAYRLFWFLVWDSTYDPLWMLSFLPLVGVGVVCGLQLAIALWERTKIQRLIYLLALPSLIAGTFALANEVDFRQLSAQRMDRIGMALESYYERQGHYPQDLDQLVPRHLLGVPRPVFIYGQNWCYEASENSFQLAYLARDHWSSPYLFAHAYHPDSQPAELERLCSTQVAAQQQRISWTYWNMVNAP
jgi:hypothetical protein